MKDDDTEKPTPIAHLIRDRPEAFDYDDVPDITPTEASKQMKKDLLRNAPPYVRKLLRISSEE